MVAAQGDWKKPSYHMDKGAFDFMNNSLTYDKPFKTYDEQIKILESRHITIPDYAFARNVLGSLSYYTIINGYKNTFLSVKGTDNFVEGTNFNDLYTLHMIDTNINNTILKYILFVERYLKTRIAYIVSEQYGVYTDISDLSNSNSSDYLFRNYYSRSSKERNNILCKIKKTLVSNKVNASVAHYANDKNHIPPWILVTNLTFGLTIKWYNILSSNDKERLCSEFVHSSELSADDKKEFISVSFSLLREYRNKIAHSDRTFNVSNLPVLPKKQLIELSFGALSAQEYNRGNEKNDLFAVILACFILLDDRYILTNFFQDLMYNLVPYKSESMNGKNIFEILGLPIDIFDRLQNLLINKFFP